MDNQCWWITGASSGIGAALAVAAAANGARLILSGRDVAALEGVAARCGKDRTLVLPFDTTAFDTLASLVGQAIQWAGKIDCLVNNAGISQRSLAVDTEFPVYERIITVDLLAPIALTQALLPHFVASGGGRVIAISSIAGIVGVPMRTAYSAAKHGVFGYFDALRSETAHLGIEILVVAPGSIKTNVSRNALLADGSRRGESDPAIENGLPPEQLAAAILTAIADGERELIISAGPETDLAMLRRSDPGTLFDKMAGMVRSGYADKLSIDAEAG
jgi:dehydrogenase/reductase SDR family member 7B